MQQRLSRNQQEIWEATSELAVGLTTRGENALSLHEAAAAMQDAIQYLGEKDLADATSAEQRALAALIRARKEVRKMLSKSNSSNSECRKFDRAQRQKLRTPEEKNRQQKEQLAETRKQLDELAQQQRKWSEDVKSSSASAPPQDPSEKKDSSAEEKKDSQSSSSSSSSSSSKPATGNEQSGKEQSGKEQSGKESDSSNSSSPSQLAERQQKMLEQAQAIQDRLAQLEAASEAARDQAEQASQNIEKSLSSLKEQQSRDAADKGNQAADQLEQLSEHLAAVQSTDTLDRLHQAQGMAQRLAREQSQLGEQLPGQASAASKSNSKSPDRGSSPSELATRERALATEGDLLAELLERVRADAGQAGDPVEQGLETIHGDHLPREITKQMREAAASMEKSQWPTAARGSAQAAEKLRDLSAGLGQLTRDLGQPKLQELIATEEQLSGLLEQLGQEGSNRSAAIEQRLSELERRLQGWAANDPRLDEALQQMHSSPTSKSPGGNPSSAAQQGTPQVGGGNPVPPGFYSRDQLLRSGWREVNHALQAKIQEIIVAGALLDANEPVPPEYRELVDEYYRRLSDDLR